MYALQFLHISIHLHLFSLVLFVILTQWHSLYNLYIYMHHSVCDGALFVILCVSDVCFPSFSFLLTLNFHPQRYVDCQTLPVIHRHITLSRWVNRRPSGTCSEIWETAVRRVFGWNTSWSRASVRFTVCNCVLHGSLDAEHPSFIHVILNHFVEIIKQNS